MLKVVLVTNEKWGVSGSWQVFENGTRRGDRCLFTFLSSFRLFFNVFPFPVCKAQLIGDYHEKRWGTPNTILLLIIRQY
jgi:hypothetical protein